MPQSETITRLFEKLDEQTKILHEVDKNVTSLNERSSNYNRRINDIEELNKEFITRLEVTETEISILKRDRWWIGVISSFIGGIITFIASILKG